MQTGLLTQFHKLLSSQPALKILMVAPEASPYANVGGIARVIAHLSVALTRLGHDVRIFMPKFGSIDEEKYPMEKVVTGLKVPTGAREGEGEPYLICNVKTHTPPIGVPAYFLENMEFYEKRANVYGYSDDSLRWALLSRGAIEFVRLGEFVPDLIHINDWQTGLVSNYLRGVYDKDKKLQNISTLFTIHNLHYQGMFDHRNISELDYDDGRSDIGSFFDERLTKQNFLKRGVLFSDVVNTVSETYAREILTPAYGECLEKLLLEVRSKIFGITNGIDYDEFNPATDPNLANNYDVRNLADRYRNKTVLQKEFGLKEDPFIPVIAAEGRLDVQKGLDMTIEPLSKILSMYNVQFIAVGGGDLAIADNLRSLKNAFPDKVGLHLMPNFALPRLLFAGSDIMIFPSRFEPCGLVQMEGMRYGAVPVARAVGGLADTVKNYDAATDTGYGFVFKNFDPWHFFGQMVRALEVYNNKDIWLKLVERCMEQDFSWDASATKYVDLYCKSIRLRRQELVSSGQLLPSEA